MKNFITIFISLLLMSSCGNNESRKVVTQKTQAKHHLNIPEGGIESLMEENSQKILEGSDDPVVIVVGNVTRKEADITIKQNDKILLEKMVAENKDVSFNYEGTSYTVKVGKIKKPLLGQGKVNIRIQ